MSDTKKWSITLTLRTTDRATAPRVRDYVRSALSDGNLRFDLNAAGHKAVTRYAGSAVTPLLEE